MKFKLDENLGERGRDILQAAGHDAASVSSQEFGGVDDETLIGICRREGRCLVTLDLDFASPLRFPPEDSPGIAVLRLPRQPLTATCWVWFARWWSQCEASRSPESFGSSRRDASGFTKADPNSRSPPSELA